MTGAMCDANHETVVLRPVLGGSVLGGVVVKPADPQPHRNLAAVQQCLEAERSVPGWGHCPCGDIVVNEIPHRRCCKCGDWSLKTEEKK